MSGPTLSERMAGMARDLHAEGSPQETLQLVVDSARDLIEPCAHAGISLATRRGQIRTSAATDDTPTRADELQQATGQGPCMDAVWSSELVSLPDLGAETRWPRWSPLAVEQLEVASMLCFRLFTHADLVGALSLYSREPAAFSLADVEEGIAIAAHAAVALAAAESIQNLQDALRHRSATSQAIGILMVKHGLSAEDSFGMIRRLSGTQHRKLHVLAQEIVDKQEALAT